jgi:hypothetical protein
MTLPARQQRALDQIERTLGEDHPDLELQFAIFTRLADPESMPVTERVAERRWRSPGQGRVSQTVAVLVALAIASAALLALTLIRPTAAVCPGTAGSIAAQMQSAPTRGPACHYLPAQPAK